MHHLEHGPEPSRPVIPIFVQTTVNPTIAASSQANASSDGTVAFLFGLVVGILAAGYIASEDGRPYR
jgi:hypothetical protein